MFSPKYRLLLKSENFPSDSVICLGTQLVAIIDFLKDILPIHMWYGADIEATGLSVKKYDFNTHKITQCGDNSMFIQYCFGIDQFIWGVFLGLGNCFNNQDFSTCKLGTEDEPFREIELDGILIEIRTFDTSFFEIYSEDEEIIKKISQKFNSRDVTYK